MSLLALHNVSHHGLFEQFSLEFEPGMQVLFTTSDDQETRTVLQLLTGLQLPDQGRVTLFAADTATLSRSELLELRRALGVVTANGGLISNLKLWENIVLPQQFRSGAIAEETAATISRYFEFFGYSGSLMVLPGHLTAFERRMAAFIRAVITTPELMIYAGCFDTLTSDQRWLLLQQTQQYHQHRPSQLSIYISASTTALEDLHPDLHFNLRSAQRHMRQS